MVLNHDHLLRILHAFCLVLLGSTLGCTGRLFPMPDPNIQKVAFHFEGQAQSVCILGDFNQWTPDSHCLKQRKGLWSIRMTLPRGPVHYAFIVDGKQWVMDPKALYVENDGFGQQNSVVMVE